jgi:hypothetical protein
VIPGHRHEYVPGLAGQKLGHVIRVGHAVPTEPEDPGPGIVLECHFPGDPGPRTVLLGPDDVNDILDLAVQLGADELPLQ